MQIYLTGVKGRVYMAYLVTVNPLMIGRATQKSIMAIANFAAWFQVSRCVSRSQCGFKKSVGAQLCNMPLDIGLEATNWP